MAQLQAAAGYHIPTCVKTATLEAGGGQTDSPVHHKPLSPQAALQGSRKKMGHEALGEGLSGDRGDSPCTGKGHLAFILVLTKLLGEHARL